MRRHPVAKIDEREANVQDAATGAGGSFIAGLHADSHGASRLSSRAAEPVRASSPAILRYADEGNARQGGPITRHGGATEDQSQSAAGRRVSR